MTLSHELRGHLAGGTLHGALSYAGPGRVVLTGPDRAVRPAVHALSRLARPDLAIALVAGMPAQAGAAALAAVEAAWPGLVPVATALDALLAQAGLPSPGSSIVELTRALEEARGLICLGVLVDIDGWDEELARLAADSNDPRELLAACLAGDSGARLRLPSAWKAVCVGHGIEGPLVGRSLPAEATWDLCRALATVDLPFAVSIAQGFCHAVAQAASVGAFAPAAFAGDGSPLGPLDDPGIAAVALLLSADLLQARPLDSTPPVRGGELDEVYHLATAQQMEPTAEIAPGVTAGELMDEHRRPYAPDVVQRSGVSFSVMDGRSLQTHLFTPAASQTPAPVVVFVHGGGWESGSPAKFLRQAVDWAAAGWVTAAPAYRLVPQVVWPGPLDDVLAVLRFIADHAVELHADVSRVALVGNSAGGHLALMAAIANDSGLTGVEITAVVTISPLTDTQWPALVAEGERLLSRLCGGDAVLRARANPATQVRPGLPPVLTITGARDELTTPAMVADFHAKLDLAGVPNELDVLPDRWHAFEFAPADARLWSERAFAWLTDRFTHVGSAL
jgi:acetyl esterase/lipase